MHRMENTSRREMIGLTTAAILAPLELFAQSSGKIPAEIEAKIPPVETIDTIVRDYVRDTKGNGVDTNALVMRILGEERLAGINAFEGPDGIVERMEQLRLLFAGDTSKMRTLENAWLNAVATKKVAVDANETLLDMIAKYVLIIEGGADASATMQNAQQVRTAALRIALANDILIKMRAALTRIRIER